MELGVGARLGRRRIEVAHTRAREVSVIDLDRLERAGVLVVGYGADGLAYSGL